MPDVNQREVATRSGPIRCRDEGTGPPLLFFHAVLLNGASWRKVVERLRGEYRCIVPDWPMGGHAVPVAADADLTPPGLAELAVDVLDGLGLDQVTVVGNDTGGALCQVLAAEHPDRVAAMVLTDCDAFADFPPRIFRPVAWVAARVPGALRLIGEMMRFRLVQQTPFAYRWLAKRPLPPEVIDGFHRPLRANAAVRRDAAKVLRSLKPRYTREAAARLRSFPRPVLVAWAPEDRLCPFRNAERLAAELPDTRLERIEDSYTLVAEDQPARVADLIASFVRERVAS